MTFTDLRRGAILLAAWLATACAQPGAPAGTQAAPDSAAPGQAAATQARSPAAMAVGTFLNVCFPPGPAEASGKALLLGFRPVPNRTMPFELEAALDQRRASALVRLAGGVPWIIATSPPADCEVILGDVDRAEVARLFELLIDSLGQGGALQARRLTATEAGASGERTLLRHLNAQVQPRFVLGARAEVRGEPQAGFGVLSLHVLDDNTTLTPVAMAHRYTPPAAPRRADMAGPQGTALTAGIARPN